MIKIIFFVTFIRWQGNKSKYLKHIIKYIPDEYNTYIEPFVGSGSVFLKLKPNKWIINDLNKDLINIWNTVKESPDDIIKEFKTFGKKFKRMSNENKKNWCKELTSKIEYQSYDIQRAIDYLLMVGCSYLGTILINNKLYFSSLNRDIYEKNQCAFLNDNYYNNLLDVSDFLNHSRGKIYNKDYKKILSKAKEGDFIFLDPPYIENHDYQFNYNKGEVLNEEFIKELYKELKELDKKNIKWLMTQADTKEVKKIFKEFKIKKFEVYRGGSKEYKNELIIMNY